MSLQKKNAKTLKVKGTFSDLLSLTVKDISVNNKANKKPKVKE